MRAARVKQRRRPMRRVKETDNDLTSERGRKWKKNDSVWRNSGDEAREIGRE